MKFLFYGLWFFFLISAFQTENNLFYLVFSIYTAFLITPYILGKIFILNIQIKVYQVESIFANTITKLKVDIKNISNRKIYFIKILEVNNEFYHLKECNIDFVNANDTVITYLDIVFKKRGKHIINSLDITFNFIVPIFKANYKVKFNDLVVIVYPQIIELSNNRLLSENLNLYNSNKFIKSNLGLVSGFKNYELNDSISKINWRYYTLTKSLIVPKYEESIHINYDVILFLNNYSNNNSYYTLELALSIVSSIVNFFYKNNFEFRLIIISNKINMFDSNNLNKYVFNKILKFLALIDKNEDLLYDQFKNFISLNYNFENIYAVFKEDDYNLINLFLNKYKNKIKKIFTTNNYNENFKNNLILKINLLDDLKDVF